MNTPPSPSPSDPLGSSGHRGDGISAQLVDYRLKELEKGDDKVLEAIEKLNQKVDGIPSRLQAEIEAKYVRRDLYETRAQQVDQALLALEKGAERLGERLTYSFRTAVTGVLLPIIVSVVLGLLLLLGGGDGSGGA